MSDTMIITARTSADSQGTMVRRWRWTASIAAAFCLMVGLGMMIAHLEHKSSDPWRSPELLKLKGQLRAEPRNEPLKTQIRELDLKLRQRYFHLLSLKASGVYLLCGGAAVFLIAATQLRKLNARPAMPKLNPLAVEQLKKARSESRLAIIACGVAAVAALLAVALTNRSPLTAAASAEGIAAVAGGSTNGAPVLADCATEAELGANWPGFRGFDGSAVVATNVAGVSVSTNVLWKSPAPAPGFNSPLVFGDGVFFTGGDAKKREVFCLDALTGQLRWRQAVENVPGSPAQTPEISDTTGYCAPTAATDGRRVYAWFANGDIVAFSLAGQRVWARHLATPKNLYGHATSLRTWQDRVIVQFDQGDPEDRLSKLLALDGRTGVTLWEKPRAVGATWATPIIIPAGNASQRVAAQIITLAVPWVISYGVTDGAELWRAELLEGEITPSPVFAGGLLNVVSPSQKVIALRVDGGGDVSKTHIVWTSQDGPPDVTSPVSNGELLFTVSSGGTVTCLDAKDGKRLWEHDLGMETQASPVISGNGLVLLSTKGDVVVVEVGREFKELSRVKLEDAFYASPAFAGGRVFLRGNKNLWCLGEKK